MIENIIIAVLIAALVGIILVAILGPVLQKTNVPIITVLGDAFVKYGWAIGVIVGVLWFFAGGSFLGFGGKR